MKSRVTHSNRASIRAISQRLPQGFPQGLPVSPVKGLVRARLASTGLLVTSMLGALALSGCYYPYGYYPGAYPGYSPYYATAALPANAAQTDMPAAPADYGNSSVQQSQNQQTPNPTATQNYQSAQSSPPTYAVAQTPPPAYVAQPYPVYPAYYPPVYPAYPAYPAYYGYPGWYGPSVSVGIGFGWGGGWGGGWHGHGGYHH